MSNSLQLLHSMGVHLIGVYLMGVYLTSVHPTGVDLIGSFGVGLTGRVWELLDLLSSGSLQLIFNCFRCSFRHAIPPDQGILLIKNQILPAQSCYSPCVQPSKLHLETFLNVRPSRR